MALCFKKTAIKEVKMIDLFIKKRAEGPGKNKTWKYFAKRLKGFVFVRLSERMDGAGAAFVKMTLR